MSLDIGKSKIATGVAISELLVVEAEKMENGSVEVVDVDFVLDGSKAELVSGAVDVTAFDAPACHPHGEAVVVVIASEASIGGVCAGCGEFDRGGASEFTAPDYEGVFEETAHFEVFEEGSDRLIALGGKFTMALFNKGVAVPRLALAMPDLDEADTALETLAQLRELGVRVAIDDFGTGHSSLSYLHLLPLDAVKVDRSFIARLAEEEGASMVNAISAIAHGLGLRLVAEGIETGEQRRFLTQAGYRYGQGFLFSKSLPPDSAAALLQRDLDRARRT